MLVVVVFAAGIVSRALDTAMSILAGLFARLGVGASRLVEHALATVHGVTGNVITLSIAAAGAMLAIIIIDAIIRILRRGE